MEPGIRIEISGERKSWRQGEGNVEHVGKKVLQLWSVNEKYGQKHLVQCSS